MFKTLLLLLLLIAQTLLIFRNANCQPTAPLNLNLRALSELEGNALVGNTVKNFSFSYLPAKNATQASAIWSSGERWTFLNMASLSGTKDGGAASIDIVSDFLGPVRFSVMGTVAASKFDSTSSSEKQRERFLSGGGTAVITASLIGPSLTWGKEGYAMLIATPRLGLDFPALGNNVDDSNANFDLGAELRLNAPFNEGNLGLFGSLRGAHVVGGSKFYESIGLPIDKLKSFWYSQLNIGLSFPRFGLALLWAKTISGPETITSLHTGGKLSLIVSPFSKK